MPGRSGDDDDDEDDDELGIREGSDGDGDNNDDDDDDEDEDDSIENGNACSLQVFSLPWVLFFPSAFTPLDVVLPSPSPVPSPVPLTSMAIEKLRPSEAEEILESRATAKLACRTLEVYDKVC